MAIVLHAKPGNLFENAGRFNPKFATEIGPANSLRPTSAKAIDSLFPVNQIARIRCPPFRRRPPRTLSPMNPAFGPRPPIRPTTRFTSGSLFPARSSVNSSALESPPVPLRNSRSKNAGSVSFTRLRQTPVAPPIPDAISRLGCLRFHCLVTGSLNRNFPPLEYSRHYQQQPGCPWSFPTESSQAPPRKNVPSSGISASQQSPQFPSPRSFFSQTNRVRSSPR